MADFATIKTNIRTNLDDAGITYFTSANIDDSCQDAYDDILFLTQCLVKKTTVNFQNNTNYYDFLALGVSDFMQTTAIFNNNNNQWLKDSLSLKQFDNIRRDWELWIGQPQWWAPHGLGSRYSVLLPKLATASGNMTLYYWAKAPTVVNVNTPLIARDFQNLPELYSTADLLEQAEEFTKASDYWTQYYDGVVSYSERTKTLAKHDLLIRI